MICPFINSQCVEAECVMWADSQCAMSALARRFLVPASPAQMTTTDPKEILDSCVTSLGRANVASLRRREIDDFLASSRIVLDAVQRRALFRMWRDIRRLVRERHTGDQHEWRMRQSNRGEAWSDDEDAELKQSHAAGLSIKRIAANHKRSEGAICSRFEKFGVLSEEDKNLQ
jgi:hypothetical protein